MYGSNQIIHAVPFNKPYDLSGDNAGTDWAWGLPPFLTTHYEYTDPTKTRYGRQEIWSGPREDETNPRSRLLVDCDRTAKTLELLDAGVIRPAVPEHRGTSHYECCGQWKTNNHHWWCENGPRYDHPYVKHKFLPAVDGVCKSVRIEPDTRTQLKILEDLVLTKRGLRRMGFKWEIPAHLAWLLQ